MRKHILGTAAVTATFAAAGLLGLAASPANAAEPAPETKTVTTHVVDREDHGHGAPPPAVWALDTFDRTVTITGGPNYVVPGTARVAAADDTTSQIADAKTKQPDITVCDLTKLLHLTWAYHAVVKDTGTFITETGPTLSPNAGSPLAGGVHGVLEGGFTADFTAPAHWCSYDPTDLDGTIIDGGAAPPTSSWVSYLFGPKFAGSAINDDWTWTYTTCSEKWWDAADESSNDGQTDQAGDITGLPCPTTPAPDAGQLPVTGSSLSTLVMIGAGLVLFGAITIVGLFASRRRRVRA